MYPAHAVCRWRKRGQTPFVRSTRRAVPAKGACPLFQAQRLIRLQLGRITAQPETNGMAQANTFAANRRLRAADRVLVELH
jgi:hypothetical protein